MAATADKYSPETRNNTSGQEVYFFLPLALTEYLTAAATKSYAQMTDAEKKDDTGFKQKFFVHAVYKLKDLNGNDCVVGMLDPNDQTHPYYNNLHSNARKGRAIRYQESVSGNGDWRGYIILNDGGLNTKPYAEFSGNIIAAYTNFIKVLCTLKSAYYLPTTKFTIDFYTVANNEETWIHSMDLVVSNASDPRFLPAKTSLTQFVAQIRNLGGVVAGQLLRLKISATNEEGTFTHPTAKEATLKASMNFIQVYRFINEPDFDNTDPTTGTPYAMLISENMYTYNENYPLQGGDLGILFNGEAGDPGIIPGAKLQGASGTAEDAYDSTIGDLPDGYYYGVPFKDFVGSNGLCYVRVNGNKIAWFGNRYSPIVPTAYTLEISFAGIYDNTTQKYYVDVYAKITGTLPNGGVSVTTTVCEGIDRNGALINPQNPITARVTNTSKTKISSTPIECEEGAYYQVANSYSTPPSTTNNYITEIPIHVDSTSIPHNI